MKYQYTHQALGCWCLDACSLNKLMLMLLVSFVEVQKLNPHGFIFVNNTRMKMWWGVSLTSDISLFLRFLEAMSFVFPLMLMIPWVLFVADFVKKLVHERELRLHEVFSQLENKCHYILTFLLSLFCILVLKIIQWLMNINDFELNWWWCDM